MLHRLEFRDLLLERDALVGITHADLEHRFQAACDLQASRHRPHQHQRGLIETFWRRLDRCGCNAGERHGIAVVAGEIEAGLDPATGGVDQRDRETAGAAGEHGDMFGLLGKGNAARATG